VISAAFFSASTPCCFCVSGKGVARTAFTRSERLLLQCRAGAERCVICSCILLRRLKLLNKRKYGQMLDRSFQTLCMRSNSMLVITGLARGCERTSEGLSPTGDTTAKLVLFICFGHACRPIALKPLTQLSKGATPASAEQSRAAVCSSVSPGDVL
jgi:hypothetical protein